MVLSKTLNKLDPQLLCCVCLFSVDTSLQLLTRKIFGRDLLYKCNATINEKSVFVSLPSDQTLSFLLSLLETPLDLNCSEKDASLKILVSGPHMQMELDCY